MTQADNINRIVYMWMRYSGIRAPEPEGKKFSKSDISNLISRLEKYKYNPEKFDWNSGEVLEEDEAKALYTSAKRKIKWGESQ